MGRHLDDHIIGPFCVEDGVKMTSPVYIELLKDKLMPYFNAIPSVKVIESYWAVFKSKLYTQNKQYSNKNDLWESIVRTFSQMEKGLVKKLTRSMDGRVVEVLKKNGSYVCH